MPLFGQCSKILAAATLLVASCSSKEGGLARPSRTRISNAKTGIHDHEHESAGAAAVLVNTGLGTGTHGVHVVPNTTGLEELRVNVIGYLLRSRSAASMRVAVGLARSLLPNGSWPDVTYHPPKGQDTRNNWPPLLHITRVVNMSVALTGAGAGAGVASKALQALHFWLNANLSNPDNWYHNQISNPIAVGQASILLQEHYRRTPTLGLDQATVKACARVMARANWSVVPPGMLNVTGANLVWKATAHVYSGLLQADMSLAAHALRRMWQELDTTRGQCIAY